MSATVGSATAENRAAPPSMRSVYMTTVAAFVAGGVAAFLVAMGSTPSSWADGFRWVLYMLAAASVSVILGLIFGVPRARADFSAEATERYSSNSNLEQISDWLTKLLVGAGLVELKSLPGLAQSAGDSLGAGMVVPNAAAFSVAAIVYGAGVGFTSAYLWTRLHLRLLLERSDASAAEASRQRDRIMGALRKAQDPSTPPELDVDIKQATDRAIASTKSADVSQVAPILWVDDNPSNNAAIVAALTDLNIRVDLALSTREAMERMRLRRYGLVISDLGRREDGELNEQAGLDLIRAIRDGDRQTPIIIYAGRRGLQRRDELVAAGASVVTSTPSVVFSEAVRVVTAP